MKTIFILCDTVNRRMLEMYGSSDPAITPNLSRLAARGMVFDNHFVGSAPCMPARLDILTGRLGFLEKPWGAVEPFHQTMPRILMEKNVHCQMFSDHSHYLIPGGENYTKDFTAFEVFRGQEGDPCRVRPDRTGIRAEHPPVGFKGVYSESEEENRRHLKSEADYSSVQTLSAAARWLDENHEADNFLLWAEAFDPHEPYDVPLHYLDLYEKRGSYTGQDWVHPDYRPNGFDEDETRHLQNRCKALLTMTDRYIGELLDVLDRHGMWEDTMVVFTTDHGFHLGEHGYMAKNYMPPYDEVFHIPFIVAAPGTAPGRTGALTQSIDLLPTFMEWFGVSPDALQYPIHGKSLLPLLHGQVSRVHDDLIMGYFGKQVAYTDGKYSYFRAAKNEANRPLYVYTAMPTILRQFYGANDGVNVSDYDKIACGHFLPWTGYPVFRIPADIIHFSNPSQEFMTRSVYNADTVLFDRIADPAQEHPLTDARLEADVTGRLAACLKAHDCPPEQFERLGLPS